MRSGLLWANAGVDRLLDELEASERHEERRFLGVLRASNPIAIAPAQRAADDPWRPAGSVGTGRGRPTGRGRTTDLLRTT